MAVTTGDRDVVTLAEDTALKGMPAVLKEEAAAAAAREPETLDLEPPAAAAGEPENLENRNRLSLVYDLEPAADAAREPENLEDRHRLSYVYGLEPATEADGHPGYVESQHRVSIVSHLESVASSSIAEDCPDLEEFEIEIPKLDPSEGVGISALTNRTRLVAGTNQTTGLIARWNAEHPEQLVKYGSVIVDVNGVSDSMEAMAQECKACTAVKLKVQRRRRYTVVVPDRKQRLGLDICPNTMKVLTITTSRELCDRVALASWNLTCPDGMEILPGDVVVKVNGRSGTPDNLMQMIRHSKGELRMVFERS